MEWLPNLYFSYRIMNYFIVGGAEGIKDMLAFGIVYNYYLLT